MLPSFNCIGLNIVLSSPPSWTSLEIMWYVYKQFERSKNRSQERCDLSVLLAGVSTVCNRNFSLVKLDPFRSNHSLSSLWGLCLYKQTLCALPLQHSLTTHVRIVMPYSHSYMKTRKGRRSSATSVRVNKVEPESHIDQTNYIFSSNGTVEEVSTFRGNFSAGLCSQLGGVHTFSETVGKFAAEYYKDDFQKHEVVKGCSKMERRKLSNRKSTNAKNRAAITRLDVLENSFLTLEVQNESLEVQLNQIECEIIALHG